MDLIVLLALIDPIRPRPLSMRNGRKSIPALARIDGAAVFPIGIRLAFYWVPVVKLDWKEAACDPSRSSKALLTRT
jgi:hypothetical protein